MFSWPGSWLPPEKCGHCNAFDGSALEITHSQYHIGLQVCYIQHKRGLHKGVTTRKQESLVTVLKVGYLTVAKNIDRDDYGHGLNLAISHDLQMEI